MNLLSDIIVFFTMLGLIVGAWLLFVYFKRNG